MKTIPFLIAVLVILSGCAPKLGEDLLIEPQGTLRLESSKADIAMEILSAIGLPASRKGIRVGSDVKIINHWKSDITLRSLTYTLTDTHQDFASGEAALEGAAPIVIAANSEKIIPLTLLIEPSKLSTEQFLELLDSKHALHLQGSAVISVWGIPHRYTFDKDIGKYLTKKLTEKIPND